MASTLTRAVWPDIPRQQLLGGLRSKNARIARSDQPDQAGKPFRVDEDTIEVRIPL